MKKIFSAQDSVGFVLRPLSDRVGTLHPYKDNSAAACGDLCPPLGEQLVTGPT